MKIPADKRKLLEKIVDDLKIIDGVEAIVLGGSYAIGLATEASDLDIGIYYSEKNPFEIERIKMIAEKYSDSGKPTVTGFYEWGEWVNGGAWINTAEGEVDLLYKNIDQIARTLKNAKKGIWKNDYEQQPPYGFSSVVYLAETHSCIPLYDPQGVVRKLKDSIQQYPRKLKQSVIQKSLWSAEFTIWQAEKFAGKADLYNTAGCLTRAMNNIVSALFALNEIYPLGDKRAIEIIEKATYKPVNLTNRINEILCFRKNTLGDNVKHMKLLFIDTVGFADGQYQPYYEL